MFKIEQIPIKPFHTLRPASTVTEMVSMVQQGLDVFVLLDHHAYVFTSKDLSILLPAQDQLPLREFLAGKEHLASNVLLVHHDIRELHAALADIPDDVSRPVVVMNGDQYLGSCPLGSLLKHTLSELLRLDAYFSTLSETVTDAVTVVDRSGSVICWNENAEEIYGIPKEQIVGRRIGEHFDPESLMVLKMLDEGRLLRGTYHRPRPDTHVLINASPIYDISNRIIGSIATEQDITHLVRLNDELATVQSASNDAAAGSDDPFSAIKGKGAALEKALHLAKKVAATDTACLLIGEAGTGKDLFAQVIHSASSRAEHPFVIVNCGSIPAGLLDIELFGYQGGAFSGQETGKAGQLELAGAGTIFLNEIDKLPSDIQVKLYHAMQTQLIIRNGAETPLPIQARILAGTDQNLADLVASRSFRGDLYYALNIVSIALPPLRERKEDIPSLAHLYVREFALQYSKPIPSFDPEVMLAFMSYKWPGNLRELKNVIERCIILCDGERVTMDLLPDSLIKEQPQLELALEAEAAVYTRKAIKPPLTEEDEISLIEDALSKTFGNKSAAAKLLGISRGTLYNKMKEFHIQ